MYAVIKTGGKQYRVARGQILKIEKIPADEGASVDLDQVLMLADGDQVVIGAPYVEGAKVTATVEAQARARKIEIVKFRRRKHSRKHMGHRQSYTQLRITGISGPVSLAKQEETMSHGA